MFLIRKKCASHFCRVNTNEINSLNKDYNAKKVNCSYVYSAYILNPVLLGVEFVNKNRCSSVRLVSEEVKSIKF